MLLDDVLTIPTTEKYPKILRRECSTFFEQSTGLPIYRMLPESYEDFRKVKVRLQKKKTSFVETFNKAFDKKLHNLRQRAVLVNGIEPKLEEGHTSFYIFPTNGYKFMYNKEVANSNEAFKRAFDTVLEQFGDNTEQANQLIMDLLQYTYTSERLDEGIKLGSEIVIYNIPYYYAVRTSSIDYDELLTSI